MKKIYWYAGLLLFTGVFTSCSLNNIEKIKLIKLESYYSDFEVKKDKVYISCYITLENNLDKEQTIKLSATFPNDVGKLLKNAVIESEKSFTLDAKSKKSFKVVFIGDFAGKNKKNDRLLPDISILTE